MSNPHNFNIDGSATLAVNHEDQKPNYITYSTPFSMRRHVPYPRSRSSSPEPGLLKYSPSVSPISPLQSTSRNGVDHFTHQKAKANLEMPRILSLWEYHSEYGIVHPSACGICGPYIRHLSEASYSENQPSFQMARTSQHKQRQMIFADGISEGRRLEKTDNETRDNDVQRYRTERDRAQEEAASLRSRLDELQLELERVLTTREKGKPRTTFSLSRASPGEISQSQSPAECVSPRATWVTFPALSRADRLTPIVTGQSDRQTGARVTSAAKFDPFAEQAPPPTPSSVQNATPQSVDREQTTSTSGSGTFQTSVRKKGAAPKTIEHVEKIMKSAHQPGNRAALLRIKALCRQAHNTPRAQKTEVQRYLLAKWTNPTWDDENAGSLSPRPASLPTPRLEDPIEDHIAYFTKHRESLPRGIPRAARKNVLRSYLQAHRTVGLLRPEKASNSENAFTSGHRTQFKLLAAHLFSDPTAYLRLLKRNGMTVGREKTYRPYSSVSEGLTVSDVARHFAACGVSGEEAEKELYPWAQEYLSAANNPN